MTHTNILAPCRYCGHQAMSWRAPVGLGYQIACSNADCHSRHAAKGIVAHTSAQGAASIWNRRQGVSTT
jgi:hypothetical protein